MNKYDDIKLAEIRYGLEGFYLTLSKTIIITILAIVLGTGKDTLTLLLFYLPIRTFAGGFHANTSFQCLVISSLVFIGIPLIVEYISFTPVSLFITYFLLLAGYYVMAPKDTQKKPIVNNKKRFWLKIVSCMIIAVYFVIALIIKNRSIVTLMTLSTAVELLMLSPIPFALFKQRYNFKWFK